MKTKVSKYCNFDIDKYIEYYLVFGKNHNFEQYNNKSTSKIIQYIRQLNDPPTNETSPNYRNRVRKSIYDDLNKLYI